MIRSKIVREPFKDISVFLLTSFGSSLGSEEIATSATPRLPYAGALPFQLSGCCFSSFESIECFGVVILSQFHVCLKDRSIPVRLVPLLAQC